MHATLKIHIARDGLFDTRSQGSSPGAVNAKTSVATPGRNARRPLKSWAAAQGSVKFASAAQGPRRTSPHPNVNVITSIKRPVPVLSNGLHILRSQKTIANDAQTLTLAGTGDNGASNAARLEAPGPSKLATASAGFQEESGPKSA